MSQQQPQRPVTFGDVFEAQGDLAAQPITVKDAALMQKTETAALGGRQIQKGGAASLMQSAADRNVQSGMVDQEAPPAVGEEGVAILRTVVPGEVIDTEYISGQPVMVAVQKVPSGTLPVDAPAVEPLTIGEALESAVTGAGTEPVQPSDARAIKSAESRASGLAGNPKGGLGAAAQSAADKNPRIPGPVKTTISDILVDAASELPADKYVTQQDAAKVSAAERRYEATGKVREGGIADTMKKAADLNEAVGVVSQN